MADINDIIYAALLNLGIREISDARVADALKMVNRLQYSWSDSLRNAPTRENFTLSAGTPSYTIGSGGDFDTVRPYKIISAFIRDDSGQDYQVECMNVRDYDRIFDKDAEGRPEKVYYHAANPLGTLYFDKGCYAETFYLTSLKPITAYTSEADTFTMPEEYELAFIYNLSMLLAPQYNMTAPADVINLASILLNQIEQRNNNPFPLASFDRGIL